MRSLISYFSGRPLVANFIMFGIMFVSIICWNKIGKEEMPEFTFNSIRVNVAYPGAAAADVEVFITRPIEEKLKGLNGLEEVVSTSSYGRASFSVNFAMNTVDLSEKVQEVKDAVNSVSLPREAEDPVFRQFKTSEKAIIDIALYHKDHRLLDVAARDYLQQYALSFKNRLISLSRVSGVETSGYLMPEIQIKIDPKKLRKFEVSMNQLINAINEQNVRNPIGSMSDKYESEVTLIAELYDIDSLKNVIISSGFDGQIVRLHQVADVIKSFEKNTSIQKVQGHEAIIFNVQKSSSADILSAQKDIMKFLKEFKENNPDSPVEFMALDDESYDIRNRLSLIATNGIIGFILIVVILFIFLDFKSGVWVAMGIPFSLSVTLIISYMMGYTINNMTLSAIIIVLGIVVDDAIIVAENISRRQRDKLNLESHVDGTMDVFLPIVASVLTTCAAFIPLYFFTGHFGRFVNIIPTIVFLMLMASMFESSLILPSHMAHELPFQGKFLKKKFALKIKAMRENFIDKAEHSYARILEKILNYRWAVILSFIIMLVSSVLLFSKNMRYVMFPREEATSISVRAFGPEGLNRFEMAKNVEELEDTLLNNSNGMITSIRTRVGQSRRGGEVKENEASLRMELIPPADRDISLSELLPQWEELAKGAKGIESVRFLKDRFGSDSGSPIMIEIQENNDEKRNAVLALLEKEMNSLDYLQNVEVEKPVTKKEYRLDLNSEEVSRLNISFSELASTLRAYLEGSILYTHNNGDEEVDYRLTALEEYKRDINDILDLQISNKENYMVPVRNLVKVVAGDKPANIQRIDYKRAIYIYADIKTGQDITPLEIATRLETQVFPTIYKKYPSTILKFRGEIENTRESQSDFGLAIALTLALIYFLLVFLFDSLTTPFIIGAIIPFGFVGVIYTFLIHQMEQFGFFAVIGALGMIGIVINDSIVLLDKLQEDVSEDIELALLGKKIAQVTATRLRAVVVTTLTTVAGLLPTAYGWGGYDSMLAEMMLAMGWGLLFATMITLVLVPTIYMYYCKLKRRWNFI